MDVEGNSFHLLQSVIPSFSDGNEVTMKFWRRIRFEIRTLDLTNAENCLLHKISVLCVEDHISLHLLKICSSP